MKKIESRNNAEMVCFKNYMKNLKHLVHEMNNNRNRLRVSSEQILFMTLGLEGECKHKQG